MEGVAAFLMISELFNIKAGIQQKHKLKQKQFVRGLVETSTTTTSTCRNTCHVIQYKTTSIQVCKFSHIHPIIGIHRTSSSLLEARCHLPTMEPLLKVDYLKLLATHCAHTFICGPVCTTI